MIALCGTLFFIITVATTKHMVQYVFIILAFGCVYALPPLTRTSCPHPSSSKADPSLVTWVPNVLTAPAAKRAVAIALVNGLGNSASLYGVFLWPATDAPRYIPGFRHVHFTRLVSIFIDS